MQWKSDSVKSGSFLTNLAVTKPCKMDYIKIMDLWCHAVCYTGTNVTDETAASTFRTCYPSDLSALIYMVHPVQTTIKYDSANRSCYSANTMNHFSCSTVSTTNIMWQSRISSTAHFWMSFEVTDRHTSHTNINKYQSAIWCLLSWKPKLT